MVHAIMLDNYQQDVGLGEYAVSFHGTLKACRAATALPDGFETWAKSDYGSCTSVEQHDLGPEPGKIFKLIVADALGSTEGISNKHLLAAGIGFAAGAASGALLHRHLSAKSSSGRRR